MRRALLLLLLPLLALAGEGTFRRGRPEGGKKTPVLALLPGGPTPAQVGAGALSGSRGETLTFTRATTKYVETGITQDGTQLLPDPELFDSANWTAARVTLAQSATAPLPVAGSTGTPVYQFADTAVSGTHRINTTSFILAAGNYTVSLYAKAGTSNYLNVLFSNTPPGWATFDLANGAVTHSAGSPTTTMTSAGSGWWRITLSGTVGTVPAFFYLVHNPSNTNSNFPSYAGTGQYVFISAAKAESGLSATPYVWTNGKNNTLLQSVASGAPAVDYRGLLVEAAHTNLLFRSNAFTTAPWVNNGGGGLFTAAQAVAPDGTFTAWKVDQATGGFYQFVNSGLGSTGAAYSPSFYMKAITASGTLDVENPQSGAAGQWSIDLSKVSTTGWERITSTHRAVTVVAPFTAAAGNQGGIFLTQAAAYQYYLWGMQLEAGAVVHSYVPTTAAAATCDKDAASLPATNVPIARGSVEFDFTPLWSGATAPSFAVLFDSRSSTPDAGSTLYFDSNKLSWVAENTAALQSTALSWTAGQRYRLRATWGAGKVFLYRDAVLVASDTSGTAQMPTGQTGLVLGAGFNGTLPLDGSISNLKFFSR